MYMVGMLLGAITIGDLADRFGRKMGILVSVILLGGGGVLSAVSPNYYMFLAMRLLTGAGGVGLFQVTFVLGMHVFFNPLQFHVLIEIGSLPMRDRERK